MGIGGSSNIVAPAASLIGCSILTAPFNYLGVKVGSNMMPRGGVEQKNYDLLCSKVTDLVLPNISDRWCWSLEGSQEFSVKSSRILIDNTILPKVKVQTRWLRVIFIKVNVHAWRVCLDKLPTGASLSLRGMDILSIACPLFLLLALWITHLRGSRQHRNRGGGHGRGRGHGQGHGFGRGNYRDFQSGTTSGHKKWQDKRKMIKNDGVVFCSIMLSLLITLNLAKLELLALDISGQNYLSWVLDAKIYLAANGLSDTI
nr:RNA-directed DNA polymerase, eukaryota [Tanacetum cinerariifolium]